MLNSTSITIGVVILVAIIGLVVLYKNGQKKLVKKIVLALVTQAEREVIGYKKGDARYLSVMQGIYNILPATLRLLFTQQDIDNYIEDALELIKNRMENSTNDENSKGNSEK